MHLLYGCAISFIFIFISLVNGFKLDLASESQNVSSEAQQAQEAWNIINRTLPEKSHLFQTFIKFNKNQNEKEYFMLVNSNNLVSITGSSGVAVAWGFHHYLKEYCGAHLGWQVQQITLPTQLPRLNITVIARDRFRYYQNVCTTSYSFVWWRPSEWRKHIDWMALNGINLALASHGQEAIWADLYTNLNLTEEEINDYFAGPAFLSWQRMGNLKGWGGPLSRDWHESSLELQRFVVDAMTAIGITPVLPAFAGFVPQAFKRIFPTANMSQVETWNGFGEEYSGQLFLEPTDPLFGIIGKEFLTRITDQFGLTHFYNSDPFNEVSPVSSSEVFLNRVGASIYESMFSVDKQAVWLLQGWMFVHDPLYWTRSKAKAFLTSVPTGKILVLDLQAEQWPQYGRYDMYFGQPFIWCMLHNFGGTLGMFGDSHSVNTGVYNARDAANSTMVGVGLAPEGIDQNYVMYDLMLETAWRDKSVNMNAWIGNYTVRRYGAEDINAVRGWTILMGGIYNYTGLNKMRGKYAITRRPSPDIKPWAWYSGEQITKAWEHLLMAQKTLGSSEGYQHDLVDVTRQALQYKADQIYPLIIKSFKEKNLTSLENYSHIFLDIFEDLEHILASNKDFLLGNWLKAAKLKANNDEDRKLFEYNARNQITLWGPTGEIVDYANKQWSGIVADYFAPRWRSFLSAMCNSVQNNYKFNKTAVQIAIFATVEKPFTFSEKIYPTTPTGDTIDLANTIFDKWASINDFPDVPRRAVIKNTKNFKTPEIFLRELRDTTSEELSDDDFYYHVIGV